MRQVIRITSKVEGFRRLGVAHSRKPVDHPVERFTHAELDILLAEPNLTVEFAVVAAPPDPAVRRAAVIDAIRKAVADRGGAAFASGAEALAAVSAALGEPLSAEDVVDAVMTAPPPKASAAEVQSQSTGVPEPTEAERRAQTIRNAVDALDLSNKKHFTNDKKPEVKAVEEIVGGGFKTSRAEIDAAIAAKQ